MAYQQTTWPPNLDKLREVMLYIAEKSKGHVHFGATKLNKILWKSDFTAYLRLGHPITGETYRKAERGPMASNYRLSKNRLVDDNDAKIEVRPIGVYTQQRLVPKRTADMSCIPEDERLIIDEVIRQFTDKTATAVSKLSHSPGWWEFAPQGVDIPYELSLVTVPETLTPKQRADAEAIQQEVDEERAA